VVAYLGELKRGDQSGWARLGRNLSGQEKPRVWLFAPPRDDDPAVLWKRYIQLTDVEWAFRITARETNKRLKEDISLVTMGPFWFRNPNVQNANPKEP